jgi:hypothetical protein
MKNNSSIFVIVISLFIIIFLIISYFILSDSLFKTLSDNTDYGHYSNDNSDPSDPSDPSYPSDPTDPYGKEQVFHLRDNIFKYEDAQAACRAYDGRLANLEEVINAYKDGANWCSYGWSDGQLALYPTQKDFWEKLQKNSNTKYQCGVPGVNGGYFSNSEYHFGANCYGKKPIESCSDEKLRNRDVDRFDPIDLKATRYKHNLPKVAPFNENRWNQ